MEPRLEPADGAEIDRQKIEEQRALGLSRSEMSLPLVSGETLP